ncbi:MAG TPA: ferritin-like protein [Stellaceae bacterium]|nr:ferritin-like protein [Stellaceae bacterium]
MTTISNHLAVAKPDRDLDWLKGALQTAIALEHATMPYYLAATYSLEVQNYTAYNLLRSVAMEEMAHMAIACNLLAAIGGAPKIMGLAPAYPSRGLPGNAEPDLYVCLAPLSKRLLQNFMRLETPFFLLDPQFQHEAYPTISRLYDGIRGAVRDNRAQIRDAMKRGGGANQVGDDIGFSTFAYAEGKDPVPGIEAAIDEILTQGEGSTSRTLHAGPASQGEESHYCKFAEIYYGHQFAMPGDVVTLTKATEPQFFGGYPIPFPAVRNTLSVPKDGYAKLLAKDPEGDAASKDLLAFDRAYSGLMGNLDAMWNGPADKSWPTFGQAVETMAKLRVLACFNIMKHQVPPAAVAALPQLYPDEINDLAAYTDLAAPVYYGPRFRNVAAAP